VQSEYSGYYFPYYHQQCRDKRSLRSWSDTRMPYGQINPIVQLSAAALEPSLIRPHSFSFIRTSRFFVET